MDGPDRKDTRGWTELDDMHAHRHLHLYIQCLKIKLEFHLQPICVFFYSTDKPAEENEGHGPNYPGCKAYRQPRVRQVLQSSLQWWREDLENIQSQGQRWGYGETLVRAHRHRCTHPSSPIASCSVVDRRNTHSYMHTHRLETVHSVKDRVEDMMRWLFN